MFRKMVCAVFVMTVSIGFVFADEFQARITKVDGDKVTFQKMKGFGKKAEKDGDPLTLPLAKDAKVVKGKFNKEDKKLEAGAALEGGLKNELFSKISEKGIGVRITTDSDNKTITQIMTFQIGKKKDVKDK